MEVIVQVPSALREVIVQVPSALRELSGGRSVLTLDLQEGATIAQLLDAVATAHPTLERRIRDEQGRLRTHVNLFVGDENVRTLAGTATTLPPGASVAILAAISGG